LDPAGRIREQVRGPRGLDAAGRHEDGARDDPVIDEPDRHSTGEPGLRTPGLDPGEPPRGDELRLHRLAIGGRQRPRCQDLPAVWVDGAKTISTRCMSRIVRAPSAAIDWRKAPTRFSEPSVRWAGPSRIRSSVPTVPTWMRVPRG